MKRKYRIWQKYLYLDIAADDVKVTESGDLLLYGSHDAVENPTLVRAFAAGEWKEVAELYPTAEHI